MMMPDKNSYLREVRSLPRPTARQIALFASYVSTAHSWYKGPEDRKISFYFFLDRLAGVEDLPTEVALRLGKRPVGGEPSGQIDKAAQELRNYRRRFGFWNYAGERDAAGPRLRARIPEQILELGRAEVNTFLHPLANLLYREGKLVGGAIPGSSEGGFPRLEALLRQLAATAPDPGTPPDLPPELPEASAQVDFDGFRVWQYDTLLDQLVSLAGGAKGEAPESLWQALWEHMEFRNSRRSVAAESNFWKVDFNSFYPLFASERLRQLRALKTSMHRVVEFVYGEAGGVLKE